VPAFVSSFIPATGDTLDGGDRDGVIELWQVLSTLAHSLVDPRDRRGVRHDLATVLTSAVAGVAAGARSLVGIAAWAGDLPRVYWSRFAGTPAHTLRGDVRPGPGPGRPGRPGRCPGRLDQRGRR